MYHCTLQSKYENIKCLFGLILHARNMFLSCHCIAPCAPGSVQLITSSGSISSTSSGVVRMCNSDGHYFLVCDSGWDYVDASVACKSVGYSPYGATRYHDQQTQPTAGYSFLSSVSCDGSESTLSECPVDPRSTSCSYNYAGVSCQGRG